jgi:hypothetical protein
MPKILVTDCWTNKVLSVVRSLGRAGVEVHVLTHRRIAAAPWSTFVKKRTLCPDPYTSISELFQVDSAGMCRMTSSARYFKDGVGSSRPS